MALDVPLGILSLAAVLEQKGFLPNVVDLNRFFFEYSWPEQGFYRHLDFCSFAAARLAELQFDVIGFSTMCSSFPLTLRLAQEIRRTHPGAMIVLGGPQASVVDEATLAAFTAVDVIVRGEAEVTFPRLLGAVADGDDLSRIPGITYRRRGRVVRNPNAPVIEDLDSLPLPAYHLLARDRSLCFRLALELGRGCPFGCTFCSTNDFFHRRFRLKSPARLIEQMSFLHQTYGTESFDLIHDMFTVDRRRVVHFCEALLQSGYKFKWGCSARTDCVDRDLLALMSRAGCNAIFFGIETGSPRMQKVIQKGLDLEEAARMISLTDQEGMATKVSTIIGYPDEEKQDLALTVGFLVDTLRHEHVSPQLNILAPLAETPLLTQNRDRLFFDGHYSDMSHQGWQQDPADRELIRAFPEIFPNFYSVPSAVDRGYLMELNRFFMGAERRFRWLLIALHQESGHLLTVFDAWRAWRQEPANPAKYYASIEFSHNFQAFLKAVYLVKMNPVSIAVRGLLELQEALEAESQNDTASSGHFEPDEAVITSDLIPHRAPGVHVVRVTTDVQALFEALRSKQPLQRIVRCPRVLAASKSDDDRVKLMELPRLLADTLDLCEGQSTVQDIVRRFSRSHRAVGRVPPAQVCRLGLETLRKHGLVGFLRSASSIRAAANRGSDPPAPVTA
jgi:radical SAM superfamily enzyme YgiQ (UPF0313 family)